MNVKRLFLVCILSTAALLFLILLHAGLNPSPLLHDHYPTEDLIVRSHTWATNCTSITLTVKNTGTASASVEKELVNDVVASNVTYGSGFSGTANALSAGETGTITITQQFSPGIKYGFDMISASGNSYPPNAYVTTAP
jgi:hypothetical protein